MSEDVEGCLECTVSLITFEVYIASVKCSSWLCQTGCCDCFFRYISLVRARVDNNEQSGSSDYFLPLVYLHVEK